MNRSGLLILGSMVALMVAAPGFAHNIEIAGDIAGTWHVEPNHSPKAGEPAQVWVILTRQGGTILPLEAATCQLGVYRLPRQQSDEPILRPALKSIAVEQHQGIPAADITFPQTGLYQIELGCLPKTAGDFEPFQMTDQITVAETGSRPTPLNTAPDASENPAPENSTPKNSTPENSTPENPADSSPQPPQFQPIYFLLLIVLGAIAAIVVLRRLKR